MISFLSSGCSHGYALGLLFIFFVAMIWAGSLFAIYLPLWQLWIALGLVKDPPTFYRITSVNSPSTTLIGTYQQHSLLSSVSEHFDRSDHTIFYSEPSEAELVNLTTNSRIKGSDRRLDVDLSNEVLGNESNLVRYSHVDIMKIALFICPFWFGSNCCYYYSLMLTSVSSSTIISNLSGTFALIFSASLGLESVTFGKIFGLLICFSGIILTALQDSSQDSGAHRSVIGDFVALLAAAGYGIYTVALRRKIPNDECISMQLLLGYLGLFNFFMFLPVLLAMVKEIQGFSLPVFGAIFVTALSDNVLSDYMWARAVVLTSPTVATIGMSITIPLAIISDFFLGKENPSLLSGLGAALVVVGFVAVNTDDGIWMNLLQFFKRFIGRNTSTDTKNNLDAELSLSGTANSIVSSPIYNGVKG